MATYYCVGSGTWNNANTAIWSTSSGGATGAGPPTAFDTVIFDSHSGNTTVASTNACAAFTSTNFTGTFSGAQFINVGATSTLLGSLGDVAVGAATVFSNSGIVISGANNTQTCNLTSGGVTIPVLDLNGFFNLNQLDNLTVTGQIAIQGVVYTTNNHTLNAGSIAFQNTLGLNGTMNAGSSSINLTGTSTVWGCNNNVFDLTLNMGTSTINITDTSGSSKVFGGSMADGYAYHNLHIEGPNTTVDASATYATISIDAGATAKLQAGKTQTITNLVSNGVLGNLANLASATATSQAILSTSQAIAVDYISITDSDGTGTGSYTALCHSTNGGDNTNWTFITPCPNDAKLSTLSTPCS